MKDPIKLTYRRIDEVTMALQFDPSKEVVIEGIRSAYIDVAGRLHVVVSFVKSKERREMIARKNAQLIKDVIDKMTVKT